MLRTIQLAANQLTKQHALAVATCGVAWQLSSSVVRAHMPEGSARLMYWGFFFGASLVPVFVMTVVSLRLRAHHHAGHARERTQWKAGAMALLNVLLGGWLLRMFIAELHRPRLKPEARVLGQLTETQLALVFAVTQIAVGLVAAGHVVIVARAERRRRRGGG